MYYPEASETSTINPWWTDSHGALTPFLNSGYFQSENLNYPWGSLAVQTENNVMFEGLILVATVYVINRSCITFLNCEIIPFKLSVIQRCWWTALCKLGVLQLKANWPGNSSPTSTVLILVKAGFFFCFTGTTHPGEWVSVYGPNT